MLRNGRPILPGFEPNERLFYRLEQFYPVDTHPSGLSLRRPEFSVNRQNPNGKPEFVIIPHWLNYGIAEFIVDDIPSLESEQGIPFTWHPMHLPDDENYYHSEVHTYKRGSRVQKSGQISELVWRVFKQRLGEKMVVTKSYVGDKL